VGAGRIQLPVAREWAAEAEAEEGDEVQGVERNRR